MPTGLGELEGGACHLWYWRVPERFGRPLGELEGRFLDAAEGERYARFRVAPPAHLFLASRFLLRTLLSRYWPARPEVWHFTANRWGRPRVAEPAEAAGLHFNLSHTDGLVACLVGDREELGVDTETSRRPMADMAQIAGRFFAPREVAALSEIAEAGRQQRFFEFWTLKESYIKARGIGLSLGLSNFAFTIGVDRVTIAFEPGFDDDPAAWDFRQFRVDPDFLIATSVRRRPGEAITVAIQDAAPLMAEATSRPPGK
ncbi:MAG: 4'-phosphopantetheinyl transferase superfamily protein [Bryobacteraceae bacterium]|jgi:4'-phosphopantetheinyl transferase